jgi:hypothetical protein
MGLVAIAFYDTTYETYERTLFFGIRNVGDTDHMKEWADDFRWYVLKDQTNILLYGETLDLYFPMNNKEDVLNTIEWLNEVLAREGEEITSIYFYDCVERRKCNRKLPYLDTKCSGSRESK